MITATAPQPEPVAATLAQAGAAARRAGRHIGTLPYVMESPICVLQRSETLASPRVIDLAQPWVMISFRWQAALGLPAEAVPEPARNSYQAYLASIDRKRVPAAERHLAIWEGAFTPQPDQRRFVTPEVIRASMLAGDIDEVTDRVRALERAGLTQLAVWPDPAGGRWEAGDYLDGVRAVMTRLAARS